MDFLGFTLSVWSAIALGVFFLFMVAACTADRNEHENIKWFGFWIGLLALVVWQWRVEGLHWNFLASGGFWKAVGLYVGAGLVYSLKETRMSTTPRSGEGTLLEDRKANPSA